jgi:hypothetical protein
LKLRGHDAKSIKAPGRIRWAMPKSTRVSPLLNFKNEQSGHAGLLPERCYVSYQGNKVTIACKQDAYIRPIIMCKSSTSRANLTSTPFSVRMLFRFKRRRGLQVGLGQFP